MKRYKGKIMLDSGKYHVTFPAETQASNLSAAGQRMIAKGLEQWRKNGHSRLPVGLTLVLKVVPGLIDALPDED